MIYINRNKWDSIFDDYKGVWSNPNTPNFIGKKYCFSGCIQKDGGTALAIEGIHFLIVD
jgi:hypothetical protein